LISCLYFHLGHDFLMLLNLKYQNNFVSLRDHQYFHKYIFDEDLVCMHFNLTDYLEHLCPLHIAK
jgi:Leucine-rich repeat (LRR) protein